MKQREDWPRLGTYVVSARKSAGFSTRRAFATAVGVTDRTLGKLEGGERVSPDTLAAVADAVGWTPDSPQLVLSGREPVRTDSTHPHAAPFPPAHDGAARQEDALARLARSGDDVDDNAAQFFPGAMTAEEARTYRQMWRATRVFSEDEKADFFRLLNPKLRGESSAPAADADKRHGLSSGLPPCPRRVQSGAVVNQ